MVSVVQVVLLFVLVDIAVAAIFNGSFLDEVDNRIKDVKVKTRRQEMAVPKTRRKAARSTSSSSGEKKKLSDKSSLQKESLELSDSTSSSSGKKPGKKGKKSYKPKSSKERKGWRKWHRKCTPCPEDMHMKWSDPRINWICGSYQHARRSFKSLCMMHYRNCQDGTMFIKMADHRCKNSSDLFDQGEHFFYEYDVKLSGQSSKSKTGGSSDSSSSSVKSSSVESWDSDKFGHRHEELEKNDINFLNKVTNRF